MPKKRGKKGGTNTDFTINDCANAPKPVSRVKKSVTTNVVPEKSWDEIQDDDFDIVEETDADGTKVFVYKKKKNHSKSEKDLNERPGIVYPEIVWYLISPHIKPEDVGNFAGINQATYAITKRESFWRALYRRYCQKSPKLPENLRIENNYKLYGLRQRVIRALYHTYDVFILKVQRQAQQPTCPHKLEGRRCVNVWYRKRSAYWSVYFKLKKPSPDPVKCNDVIEELGRIDANPEEDSKVLQVKCQNFYGVPPLMGMTLSCLRKMLSQNFRYYSLFLGFNSGQHYVSQKVNPECIVVIDTVVETLVDDWWNPEYPHFESKLPSLMFNEESLPMLKTNFFSSCKGDL